jgi:hypothetical protein
MDVTRSDRGHLPGVRIDTDEVAHSQDVVTAGALAAEAHVATPEIAFVASSFAQKALLAGGTLVDRLGDQPMVAKSESALAAFGCALHAAAVSWEGVGADRTDSV